MFFILLIHISNFVAIGRVHEDETSNGSNNRGVYAGYEA